MDEDNHLQKQINANAGEQSPAFAGSEAFLERIANFTNLHKNVFGNSLKVEKKTLSKNTEKSVSRVKVELATQQCMRFKKSNLFEDSNEGRLKCFEEIYRKILQDFCNERIMENIDNDAHYLDCMVSPDAFFSQFMFRPKNPEMYYKFGYIEPEKNDWYVLNYKVVYDDNCRQEVSSQ